MRELCGSEIKQLDVGEEKQMSFDTAYKVNVLNEMLNKRKIFKSDEERKDMERLLHVIQKQLTEEEKKEKKT